MTDATPSPAGPSADLLLLNGRIETQDDRQSFTTALAIKTDAFTRLSVELSLGNDPRRKAH